MIYNFNKKFTEKDIDEFIDKIYNNYTKNPDDEYIFDLTQIEWISNQGLLVFTALLKYFIEKDIDFKVKFIEEGIPTTQISKKTAIQLVQIWETWKIWKIVKKGDDLITYFSIDGKTIDSLKRTHKIHLIKPEIYNRYGITPFICLNYINNYSDKQVEEMLLDYITLNEATKEIINYYDLEHPFVNNIIGTIISKELYENFLDHNKKSFFDTDNNWAFMNLSIKAKIDEEKNSFDDIQKILKSNFEKEEIPETINFFKDKSNFKNNSYVQFSFLDFGEGIINTIESEYDKEATNNEGLFKNYNNILKYAFQYNTSRHPIKNFDKNDDIISLIPRGLFDVLSIVKRYKGLIIIRSSYGKIFYDFSNNKSIKEAYNTFGKGNYYFPGTLINIYLPALNKLEKNNFDSTAIKPEIIQPNYEGIKKINYLSIYNFIPDIKKQKNNFYTSLFNELNKKFKAFKKPNLTFFSFKNWQNIDSRIVKKTIFYLLTNYNFNLLNNVVIINPPDDQIIKEIKNEILQLSSVIKKFKIHPLPLLYYNQEEDDINIQWLGVFNIEDSIKLNDTLFEVYSLTKGDFNNPDYIEGNINYFDKYGNLKSNLPDREKIIELYKSDFNKVITKSVKSIIDKNKCIIHKKENKLFLCNGDYYQEEYLQLINIFQNNKDAYYIISLLIEKIGNIQSHSKPIKYISITSSSHKITDLLIKKGFLNKNDLILLDNYHSFEANENLKKISNEYNYILICDVISTGYLTNRIENAINKKGASLLKIIAIVNTIDPNFDKSESFLDKFNDKIVSLFSYRINKYRRNKIKERLQKSEIIRINPFTNIPITLNIPESDFQNILINSDEFLEYIEDSDIKVGYYLFNGLIHPYFFNTTNIISKIKIDLLRKIFNKLNLNKRNLKIIYPKNSGFEIFDFSILKNEVLSDHSISTYEIDRYITKEGWKFPHTTDYLIDIVKDNNILILDDGTNTGDSIIQMINEIKLFNPKNINVLCLIGRTNIYKKDFFTSINKLKDDIDLNIFFASHWYIPTYYLDNNPNSNERHWLRNVINKENIPLNIKKISEIILKELLPQKDDFTDYRFLPVDKENGKIPKKELIRVRNEVGKIISYRYYKESFKYFDDFIKLYEGKTIVKNRYQEIELLCSTIIYEPYIYDKLKQIVPDVINKIKEFIDALIFRNSEKNRNLDIDKDFTYKWNRKDIVHLFFIVYKNDELYNKLSNSNNLIKLISYIGDANYSINYILYKLLFYYPLTKEETHKKNGGKFTNLINSIIENNKLEKYHRDLKIFKSFIMTLPSNNDYYSELLPINNNYQRIKQSDFHKESISPVLDSLLSNIQIMNESFNNKIKQDFISNWEKVSSFIEAIISFYNSFNSFFIGATEITGSNKSLSSLHGILNNLIHSLNNNSDFSNIEYLLRRLESKFISSDSELFKVFTKIYTVNINSLIRYLFKEKNISLKLNSNINDEIKINFPKYYFEEIILKEIVNNLRHRDKNKEVIVNIHIRNEKESTEQYLIINILNYISKNIQSGGSNGIEILKKLNDFPKNISSYKRNKKTKVNIFDQELKFKIL